MTGPHRRFAPVLVSVFTCLWVILPLQAAGDWPVPRGPSHEPVPYRYDPAASPDGLAGDEGTFSLCTFWYVEALARVGRLDDARLTFEKMFTYANHLGLFSEEIGSTGEQLGNFPQAFSHLALITAAVNLDYQLDHGAGMLPPGSTH